MGRGDWFCNVVMVSHPNVLTIFHLVQHMKTDAGTAYLTYPYSRNNCWEERKKRQKAGIIVEGSVKEESTLTAQSRAPSVGEPY